MSGIGPRNMGHGLTVALTRFVDTTIAPPSSPDPVLYRKGLQFFFRDTVGIEHPVAVGADGLGVVSIALADSPYDVQPTDRVLLVNTGDGAVTGRDVQPRSASISGFACAVCPRITLRSSRGSVPRSNSS